MKNYVIIALVLVLCLIAYLEIPAKHPSAKQTLKALKNEPVPKKELRVPKASAPAQKEDYAKCAVQWEEVGTTGLEKLQENLKRGVFRLQPECLKYEELDLLKQIYGFCEYDAQSGKLKDETSCMSQLPFYRALWLDHLTADQTDYRAMSPQLLANKILSRFLEMFQHPELKTELKKMIDELITREPGLMDARKALVTVDLASFGSPQYDANETSKAIAQALALDPKDPQMNEAYLLNEHAQGHTQAINDYLAQNPDSGLGLYFRAWDSWKSKDRSAALADLNRAAQLLPTDTRIKKTLNDVTENRPGDLFNSTVGFNLSDF